MHIEDTIILSFVTVTCVYVLEYKMHTSLIHYCLLLSPPFFLFLISWSSWHICARLGRVWLCMLVVFACPFLNALPDHLPLPPSSLLVIISCCLEGLGCWHFDILSVCRRVIVVAGFVQGKTRQLSESSPPPTSLSHSIAIKRKNKLQTLYSKVHFS